MKAVILALSIAGVAATAPLNAQILGTRLPTPSTSRGTTVNGSWQVVGQDRNGNTIYERRTYDGNGNIIVQRARRDAYGNFSIIDTRTVRNDNNRNCQYANNGTVGDIILGRSGATNCNYGNGSADGVWRQVGRGRNNNSVYERRTRDAYGNIVVQKARRNPDGTFRILSTRTIRNNDNDGVRGSRGRDDDDRVDRRRGDRDDDDQGEDNEGRGRRSHDSRYDNSNYQYNDGSYNYPSNYRYSSDDSRSKKSEHKNNGRGKGKKGRD